MSSVTPNYGFILPAVADPTDADLWGGMLNSNFTLLDTLLTDFAEKYPVGSLYFNADDSTNPATLLGYGTWVAFGAGRVIIGVGTGTDANGEMVSFSNGATGGEYNHTLTTNEIPSHNHAPLNGDSSFLQLTVRTTPSQTTIAQWSAGSPDHRESLDNPTTASTGGGLKHNNIQPYVVVYAWRRSA